MLQSSGFNLWADHYDASVNLSEEANEYPFAGYKKVLGTIYETIKRGNGRKILDIGFGTGILSQKLYDEGCSIWGIDFSANMIDIAREKMPLARFVQHDFTQGLPDCLAEEAFDFIVCTYAIHHLEYRQQIRFVKKLTEHLTPGGSVLIGDVAFETAAELEQCKAQCESAWDSDEIYPFAELFQPEFPSLHFEKISFCSGVLRFPR